MVRSGSPVDNEILILYPHILWEKIIVRTAVLLVIEDKLKVFIAQVFVNIVLKYKLKARIIFAHYLF